MDRFNLLKELQINMNNIQTKMNFKCINATEKNHLKNQFLIEKDKETNHLYHIISELSQEKLDLLEDVKMLNIEAEKHYDKTLELEKTIKEITMQKREQN
jgi:hypothetical protein